MLGPVINSACIVVGALGGAMGGQAIPPESRRKLNCVFSCIALGIGVTMIAKGKALPPVVLALLLGTILGELCRLELGVLRFSTWCVGLVLRPRAETDISGKAFRDQFAVGMILFCFSGLGIMGSMREGMTGDSSLLVVKGLLDLFTALLFAANVGGVIGALAVPQCLAQLLILCTAQALVPLTTPEMLADFTACGGFIMLGASMRQAELMPVPILNMLPGLFLVMPLSALWTRFMPA